MGRKRNLDKKSLIWHIAYDLFVKKGYKNVSVNEIAQASGVSNNLVPHYLKKSDELLIDFYEYLSRITEQFSWNLVEKDAEAMEFIRGDTRCTRTMMQCIECTFMLELFFRNDEELLNLYGGAFFNMELYISATRRLYRDKSDVMIKLYRQKLITPISEPENGESFLLGAFLSTWTIHYREIARMNYGKVLDYKNDVLRESFKIFCITLEIPKGSREKIMDIAARLVTAERLEEYILYYEKSIDEYLSKDQRR